MLEEQLSACRRELIQIKGESAAGFAARAESTMSLCEELLKGSGFTIGADGVDRYSTDRKRPQVIITGLRPVYFGVITQILPGKNDKDRYSTVIGTADKPTLIASLLVCGALIKTQQLGGPEWAGHSYKGKDDEKEAAGKEGSGKAHWEKLAKAEIKNLKLVVDSGKKKYPCARDLACTKHDWEPGAGAVGRFNERGTKYRPCAWELNNGVCTRENCQSAHGTELKETIAGYPPGWHTWRKAVQTPSRPFKASGGETKATDTTMWNSSALRDGLVESKIELKAAVEPMKGGSMKEFASILKTHAGEHSKALAQVLVTKMETRSAGSRRAAGVNSGQGSNAPITALTVEPLKEGEEGSVENCKFEEEEVRSLSDCPVLQKLEEDPLILAWLDELVDERAKDHDQTDAAYLYSTLAGGTLNNNNVAMNAVLCFFKNALIDEPRQYTLPVLSAILGIDFDQDQGGRSSC